MQNKSCDDKVKYFFQYKYSWNKGTNFKRLSCYLLGTSKDRKEIAKKEGSRLSSYPFISTARVILYVQDFFPRPPFF